MIQASNFGGAICAVTHDNPQPANLNRYSRIRMMTHAFQHAHMNRYPKVNDFMSETLGLVAIGTIADVMPMVDENRTLVSL